MSSSLLFERSKYSIVVLIQLSLIVYSRVWCGQISITGLMGYHSVKEASQIGLECYPAIHKKCKSSVDKQQPEYGN